MRQVDDTISVTELKTMPERMYGSMVNIRPRQQNASRDVLDQSIREKIIAMVGEKIHE